LRKNGFEFKPISTRVIFEEAPSVAIGQIFLENNHERASFLIARLRDYFNEHDYPLISEAIREEKEEIKIAGKNETKEEFITNVQKRYEDKLKKRKQERNRRKNLKKRAKKREGEAKRFKK